jgi:ribonuclease HII
VGLLIAGVDEAGYGPLLGPLVVGLSVFRVNAWSEGEPAPDLWTLLARSVARTVKIASGRLVLADSKELKLPNAKPGAAGGRHPLTHLERGVLTVLASRGESPADDDALLEALGTAWPVARWYDGPAIPLPQAWTAGQVAVAANPLRDDLSSTGVAVVHAAARLIGEVEFNDLVRAGGGKGATTLEGVRGHFQTFLRLAQDHPADGLRFVCDRLGGRVQYADAVAHLAGVDERAVRVVEETQERSRYFVDADGRSVGVVFQMESEKAHLPIALASMTAKYLRETAMARFNRHWGERVPELRPTAGYWQDAKRWLKDAQHAITPAERRDLVRIA